MISDALRQLLRGGVSTMLGTRDAQLVPECARAVGCVVHADGRRLTLFLPQATAARSVANLRDNGQVAVTFSEVPTHRTRQLKGRAVVVREATNAERAIMERYVEAFAKELDIVGLPPSVSRRIAFLPAHAVEIEVTEVFDQTPGPGAGARLAASEA
ncbi:MAG: pyridoxamine 5'-phosphate oxidase family protein [Polyangiaceae bacterium]|nr:pyridoxamine 5'-phosphate oxidase family protein [Polyangiaceae bacterium]MCE7893145.1 pyridoxamine 5'-phosphate oxidase family protein [Sorangiineae bacterium PRO1]MCL4749393.1 pyridoxamine 5'-phosphate oxidase family protein [Myxococcales bacterium]